MKCSWNLGGRWIAAGLFLCFLVVHSLEVKAIAEDVSEGIEIVDAKGDDYGAGKVKYPSDKLFAVGTLDMTAFRATPYSGGVQFQIDFVARVPRPPEDRKVTNSRYLRELQNNGLFLQNVDIYIDQDGRPNSGQTMTIPGRNADIAPGCGWERAVILTPQPEAAASILKMADSKLAEKVLFPTDPQLRGRTLVIDVPEEWIGSFDSRWGYVVVVTGASFDESFRMLDPNIRGFGKSIFARIVRPSRDDEYFGGGDHDGLNTNIIDMVLPEAMDQKDMLTPDHEKQQWAQLEAVFPNGRPPVGPWLAAGPPLTPTEVPSVSVPETPGSAGPAPTASSVAGASVETKPPAIETGKPPATPEAVPAVSTAETPGPTMPPTSVPTASQDPPALEPSPSPESVEVHAISATPAAPPVPSPAGPATAEAPDPLPSLSGSVVDFDTGIVVIDLGKTQGLHLGRIGRVLDENGQTLVKFVVSELLTDFSVCKIIEGDSSKLRQGLKVELKSGGEG